MVAPYCMTATTAAPSTAAVALRCPARREDGRICGRLLARMIPLGQSQLACPRCGTRTTFTFEAGDMTDVTASDRMGASL